MGNVNINYYSMKMIGEIVYNYAERFVVSGVNENLWAMPVLNHDHSRGAILIADCNGSYTDFVLELKDLPSAKDFKCILLDQKNRDCEIPVELVDGKLRICKKSPSSAVLLLTFNQGI